MARDDDGRRGRRKGSYTIYYRHGEGDGSQAEYMGSGDIYEGGDGAGGSTVYMVRGDGGRGGGGGFGGGGGGFFGDFDEPMGRRSSWRDVTPKERSTFSDQEKQELFIATGILTLCFALAFNGGIFILMANFNPFAFAISLFIALVVVSTAFVLHEMGHKFAARRYGCWAEFRYSLNGLLLALFFSGVLGFLFAAPGAVMISGRINKRQNGIISLAGPAVNFVLAYAFIGVLFIGFFMEAAGIPYAGIVLLLGLYGTMINLILGLFNMIPFPPLDGSKIITWNPAVYILLGVALLGTFIWFWTTILFV